ncbi:glycerophosphodiester phosphodiesterase [Companilactobacillus sp.]|jgi:glycerophosphoryl diester phosphodiesterase|uniref:glycerophosphodiester phosphodiesterase n=1 Tax=Companilactobacillus sp. TaxID=2767905 RepID=UPI0025BDEA72|nr:glycerophosphodiester phosphodiesterase [Companilactobacillus sp.]MCH4008724.1 glycerophosphodiester phosphodiesterase [Companilactobacillus sp.]MCH4051097.1 glycerophosphodiester phosphodiesterase [Companilactobacillus sp.]MCH4076667.1 glycerophosphodiester phosphodiesterase [Companilactobacillus sp.]MCH4125242.1 glycerophosphodiester phosphodiesterase [Companilactobacillus sp.]MCH4131782.1 glycerophosphodiester phosphodiesterase [Companilactobacillus sp.]
MKKSLQATVAAIAIAIFSLGISATPASAAPKVKNMVSIEKEIKKASPKNPIIFSHRGSPYNSPEHSFAGYDHAIKDGSHFIEQDVWLSKDGKLYVTHDDNLKRTTGKDINVSKSTSSELNKVKLRNGEPLHQLKDVFAHYKKNVHYIIEAKKNDGDNTDTEKALATQLDNSKMNKNVIIQDTDVNGIELLHSFKNQKNVPYLWLMEASGENEYLSMIQGAPKYIKFLSMDAEQATPKLMKAINKRGMLSDLWTIQTYNDNYNAIKVNKTDSLFTNNTKETKALIKDWK